MGQLKNFLRNKNTLYRYIESCTNAHIYIYFYTWYTHTLESLDHSITTTSVPPNLYISSKTNRHERLKKFNNFNLFVT